MYWQWFFFQIATGWIFFGEISFLRRPITSRHCRSCKESLLRMPERKPSPWILIETEARWRTRATELTPVDIKISLLFLTVASRRVAETFFFSSPFATVRRTHDSIFRKVSALSSLRIILIPFVASSIINDIKIDACALIFKKYNIFILDKLM